MAFKQQSGTVTQQAFRSIAQVLNDISGGLLPGHQSRLYWLLQSAGETTDLQ